MTVSNSCLHSIISKVYTSFLDSFFTLIPHSFLSHPFITLFQCVPFIILIPLSVNGCQVRVSHEGFLVPDSLFLYRNEWWKRTNLNKTTNTNDERMRGSFVLIKFSSFPSCFVCAFALIHASTSLHCN